MILRLKDKIETKPTKKFYGAGFPKFQKIESCAELKEKFNIGYYKQNLNRGIEKMALFEMLYLPPPSGVPTSGAVPSATTSESADSHHHRPNRPPESSIGLFFTQTYKLKALTSQML